MIRAVVSDGEVVHDDGGEVCVPWWSVTKTLIAAATLALVRDHRVMLDELLEHHPFTPRQLLQHRAGVTDYGGLAAYHAAVAAAQEPWPVEKLLHQSDAQTLLFAPDHGWAYSNIGYLYLRQSIERIGGADLNSVLQSLVFAPLGIDGPRVALTHNDLAAVTMGTAQSYHPGWVYHGLVVGRLRDAALTLDRLLRGDLLPPDLLARMCDAHPLGGPIEGRPWCTTGYGLGLMIGAGSDGAVRIGHTGGGPGSSIAVYRHAAGGQTIAAWAAGADAGPVETVAFGLPKLNGG